MQASGNLERSLGQIQTLLNGPNLQAKDIDLQDFSRILSKMPGRQQKENAQAAVAKLFEIAASKMKDDHDKAVLEGL